MTTLKRLNDGGGSGERQLYAGLIRINVLRAGDGTSNQPADMSFDAQLIARVLHLMEDSVAESSEKELSMALLALRGLSEVTVNRVQLLKTYGAVLVPLMIKAMSIIVDGGMLSELFAVEAGFTALANFSGDRGPREAMLEELATLSALVDEASSMSYLFPSDDSKDVGMIGNHLLVQLKAFVGAGKQEEEEEEEETTTTSTNSKKKKKKKRSSSKVTTKTTTPAIHFLRERNWDAFLACLPSTADVSHLLGLAISHDAPFAVLEALIVDKHANVDELSAWEPVLPPVLVALHAKNVVAAVYVLENGADADCRDEHGRSALYLSCQDEDFLPVTEMLVDKLRRASGDDDQLRRLLDLGSPKDDGRTALGACLLQENGQGGIAQAHCLLAAGASVDEVVFCRHNMTEEDARSLLLRAVLEGNVPMMRLLMEHGVDVTKSAQYVEQWLDAHPPSPTLQLLTPDLLAQFVEMFAAQDEATAAAQVDSAVASPVLFSRLYELSLRSSVPVHMAIAREMWLELGADVSQALHVAIELGKVDDVALFLQLGADSNLLLPDDDDDDDDDSVLPLVLAATLNKPKILKVAIASMLITAGADVDGDVLAAAVNKGSSSLVRVMLQAGASKRKGLYALAKTKACLAGVLPLLAANDGSDGLRPVDCGQFDEGVNGFGFSFTRCAHCRRGDGELHPCAGFVMVAYCDEECQRAHWVQSHKQVCVG